MAAACSGIRVRMDPCWLGSIYLDPDPLWSKIRWVADPDPQRKDPDPQRKDPQRKDPQFRIFLGNRIKFKIQEL